MVDKRSRGAQVQGQQVGAQPEWLQQDRLNQQRKTPMQQSTYADD
jgi:hypothetical protein